MRALSLTCLLAAALNASAEEIGDSIPFHGRPLEGEIVSETWRGVTMLVDRDVKVEYALSDLTGDVVFDEATIPQPLISARAKMSAGNPEEAITLYEKALAQKGLRRVLRQRALYEMARALRLARRPGDAAELGDRLRRENPDSAWLKEIERPR